MMTTAMVNKQKTHDMPEVHLDTRRLRCARFFEGETMLIISLFAVRFLQ
jgi:hypothetical protein